MHMSRLISLVWVGIILCASFQFMVRAATGTVTDQQAAMHTSARSDVTRHATVPRYQIVGTVDPSKRTWQGTQTLIFTNQTGAALRTIYFRLYANLPDIGASITLSNASINGNKTSVKYEANRFLARLDVSTPIAANASVTAVVNFTTTAANNGGTDVYGTLNSDGQTVALAMAYPLLAINTNGTWIRRSPIRPATSSRVQWHSTM